MVSLFFSRLIAVILLFSLFGCHWNDPPPLNTLVVAIGSDVKTLDPRWTTDANGQRMTALIFSALVYVDEKMNIVGDLAKSWTYKDLVYEFKLRPGLKFHNGDRFSAEDFLFSCDEFRKPSSPFAAQLENIESGKAEYDFESGGTLRLKLKEHQALFLHNLTSVKILPRKVFAPDEMNKQAEVLLVGSGPYVYKGKKGLTYLFEGFGDYYGEKVRTPYLQFKVMKDASTRFLKIYKGQIDLVQNDVPYSKIKVFEKGPRFKVLSQDGLSTTYVLLNMNHPLLKTKEFRQALYQALDIDEIIKYNLEGQGVKAYSLLTPINPYQNKKLNERPMKENVPSLNSFSLQDPLRLKTSNSFEAVENGKVIAHQWRKNGIAVDHQSHEWGTYYEDIQKGRFEIAIMKWVGIFDPDLYRQSLHSQMTPPGRNRGYYSNPDFDRLVTEALQEKDENERMNLYHKAQALIYEELPILPLWHEKQIAIIHKRVKNYSLSTNGDYRSLLKVYKEDESE